MGRSREGWTRVQFGDVVENVNDQPKLATLPLETRYIAGEHVDENRLTIDRWGTLGDDLVPPTFKRRFHPGDVLFHSRNLKKIAVPDFDGITGEKLFVLRSRSPSLLQEFIPYVLLSPSFAAYAEASWSGSVNKFLNWTPLERYEFDLPPMQEQERIAFVTKKCDALKNALVAVQRTAACAIQAGIEELFRDALGGNLDQVLDQPTSPTRIVAMHSLCQCDVVSGTTPRVGRGKMDGVPFIRVQHLGFTGDISFDQSPSYVTQAAAHLTRGLLVETGDVLMNIVGPPMGKVGLVPQHLTGALINQAIVRFRVAEQDRDLVLLWLRSAMCQRWFLRHSTKTSGQRNINVSTCQHAPAPVPTDALRSRARAIVREEGAVLLALTARTAATDVVRNLL